MWVFAPAAGAILADWGADVIKVEGPNGDPVRGLRTAGLTPDGPAFTWEMWNRNKRAIALDLTRPKAQEILHQLVADADVFLTSVLPLQRERLGIDVGAIRNANPSIIYAACSGQGGQGPDSHRAGYDGITFWARSGASSSVTPPGTDPVGMPVGAFGDSLSGLALAGGVAAALVKKARTGEGVLVEGSLLSTAMWAMQMGITGSESAGLDEMPRMTRQRPFNPLVNAYPTSDGRWIALCMLQPDRYWPGLCRAVGRADLIDDPRFENDAARSQNLEACVHELDQVFLGQPLTVWRDRLAEQDGPWDVVATVSEVLGDPQVMANGFVQRVEYPGGHHLSLIPSPIQFDGRAARLRPAPDFGEDTDEILQSLGWHSDDVIEAKIDGAVI